MTLHVTGKILTLESKSKKSGRFHARTLKIGDIKWIHYRSLKSIY